MDFEEVVVLESKQSSGTDQRLGEPVRGKFSKTVIGEDLRRAIIALRSVPRVSWSQDLIYNGNDDASTEYIWRSIDLSGSSTFAEDWRNTTKLNDRDQRTLWTNDAVPKLVASQKQNQSEIMRKDSFTVASKRIDRTSDSKCQLVEQSTTAIQMSLFSSEKPGKANNIGETSTSTSASSACTTVMKKPPPLPPKPSHLQDLKIKQPVTGRLVSDGESRIPGGVKDLKKTVRTDLDAGDVYERSLDVLEKYDSDQEDFEDLMIPRSESPECLLEELLDSVPAEEFDTMESHYTMTPSSSIKNNRADLSSSDNSRHTSGGADLQKATQNKATVKKDMLSYNNSNHKSSGVEEQGATRNLTTVKMEVLKSDNSRHNRSIAEDQTAKQNITSVKADVLCFNNSGQISREAKEQAIQTKSSEPKFNRTSSSETVSIPQKNPLTRHQRNNNLSFKPVYVHPKPVPRKLDFSALRIIHTPQIKSSSTATTPVTVASDQELTPEDIFEEIMDSLEEGREDQGKGGVQSSSIRDNNRDGKPIQQDPSGRTDYMLENEWLAIYCDQIQGDMQREMINKSRVSKRTTDPTISELSKSSTREDIFKRKHILKPLPDLPTKLPSPNGKIFPGPTLSLPDGGNYQGASALPTSQDRKTLSGPNRMLLFQNEKAPQGSSTQLPMPYEKVPPGLNAKLSSPDGKALPSSTTGLPSPDGKDLQGSNTRLNSPDAKLTLSSQDTIQTTVKRKPAAPLRETVQTYTFVLKESLMQDIKLSPTIKSQHLGAKQNPQILSNGFPAVNSLNGNSCSELKQEPKAIVYETTENHRAADSTSTAESNVRPSDEIKRLNTRSVTRKSETKSLIPRDCGISHPPDRIVPVITREIELSGCDTYKEDDMDLDLEIELSRNLDACTASDVECQSIDKLVTTESLFSSDTTVLRRPRKANSLEVRVPRKLSESLAKKRLKKSQSIDSTPVTSNQVSIKENTTISIPEKGIYSSQEANVAEFQESAVKNLKERSNFETTRKNSPGYPGDSELFKHEAVVEKPPIHEVADTTVLPGSSSGSDNEDSYKRTIIRNVRSAEKESTTELHGKQPTIQVLSEEVTSQEILLKIVWPKHESKSKGSKIIESKKPPFRELQLKRVKRISDLDSPPLDVFPNAGHSQPVLAVTQQSQNALSTGHKPQPNDGKGVTPADINTVSTKNLSEIVVEYVNQKNGRNVEHISNSAIDVQRAETVKVLRVPMAAVHKVQDIKEAVEAVGSTILSDLHGQPKKRNIRVTCEAVESKSRASLHDQDVTVIRNTIVDTYGPKPAVVFSSAPKNSVQNM